MKKKTILSLSLFALLGATTSVKPAAARGSSVAAACVIGGVVGAYGIYKLGEYACRSARSAYFNWMQSPTEEPELTKKQFLKKLAEEAVVEHNRRLEKK